MEWKKRTPPKTITPRHASRWITTTTRSYTAEECKSCDTTRQRHFRNSILTNCPLHQLFLLWELPQLLRWHLLSVYNGLADPFAKTQNQHEELFRVISTMCASPATGTSRYMRLKTPFTALLAGPTGSGIQSCLCVW